MIRGALAMIAACASAVFLYAFVRGVQFVLFPDQDPALIVWSARAGYFWRIAIVVYAAGMVAFIAWMTAAHETARVARVLARLTVVAAIALLVQALWMP